MKEVCEYLDSFPIPERPRKLFLPDITKQYLIDAGIDKILLEDNCIFTGKFPPPQKEEPKKRTKPNRAQRRKLERKKIKK